MPTKRIQLILALVTAALLGGLSGGAWLHYRALVERGTTIERLNGELAAPSLAPAELEALARSVEDQQQQLQRHQALVPPDGELGSLLEQLGEQLARAETADRQLSTGAVTSRASFAHLPLTLSFRSSYRGLWQVLQSIERDRRILRPAKLTIRHRDNDPEQPLAVELALTMFTKPSEDLR